MFHLSTSLFMFHLISFSLHFIDHVSFYFLQSTVHLIHFIYHSPSHSHLSYLFALILHGNSTYCQFQLIPSLLINDLRVSLDKFLIWDIYSLLEAEFLWFYYSLSLYIKPLSWSARQINWLVSIWRQHWRLMG